MRLTCSITGGLKDAVLYARKDTLYYGCSVSDENGVYHLNELTEGNVEIIVNRLGFTGDSVTINLTPTSNLDSINFYLYRYPRLLMGIKQSGEIPEEFKLYQNYPNPFNPVTKIKFSIPSNEFSISQRGEGIVTLKIYNVQGKEIATLINESLQPGTYEVAFDGTNLSSGIYFYRITAGNFVATKKMLVIK
jgi:hypothetical protein